MNYNNFINILEKHLHENEKLNLLESLAKNPDRFVGIFRPSNPKTKIRQFLTQSGEIRFGDAMEEIIKCFLSCNGFTMLPNNVKNSNDKTLKIDQHFRDSHKHYFIEQKVRDDHDSTKKIGQIDNFKDKYKVLSDNYGKITGIMYFIDPSLKKNKNYYLQELEDMKKTQKASVYLFYGKELFEFLNIPHVWDNITDWLAKWKANVPELMNINFDETLNDSFMEIKNLEVKYWEKIIGNDDLWSSGIIKELFQNGLVLNKMVEYFQENSLYNLSNKLKGRIDEYYR